jgi:phosphoglycolate phosphatase-like HAD superfamily hydrolase
MTRFHLFNYYLFDYDGTICNTFPTISYAMNKAFEANGLSAPYETVMLQAVSNGGTLQDTIRWLHPEASAAVTADIVKSYRQLYSDHDERLTVLFDGAANVFRHLKEADKTIVVLSNKGLAAVERSLQHHGLSDLTDLVIAEGSYPELKLRSKPDPMIYRTFITNKYPIQDGREVLMTGDTHADIQFAKNAGIVSCWAAYGYGQPEKCKALVPDFTIKKISDIL